jgi:hypothetical protein
MADAKLSDKGFRKLVHSLSEKKHEKLRIGRDKTDIKRREKRS